MGGTIQRYPRVGEQVIVAYSRKKFSWTSPIIDVINIDDSEVNLIDVVFQDKNDVWMLTFPTHANNIGEIKKALKGVPGV